jgi:hypothetical protein
MTYALRDSPVVDGSRWLPLADAVKCPAWALLSSGCCWTMWVERGHPGGTRDQLGKESARLPERTRMRLLV